METDATSRAAMMINENGKMQAKVVTGNIVAGSRKRNSFWEDGLRIIVNRLVNIPRNMIPNTQKNKTPVAVTMTRSNASACKV